MSVATITPEQETAYLAEMAAELAAVGVKVRSMADATRPLGTRGSIPETPVERLRSGDPGMVSIGGTAKRKFTNQPTEKQQKFLIDLLVRKSVFDTREEAAERVTEKIEDGSLTFEKASRHIGLLLDTADPEKPVETAVEAVELTPGMYQVGNAFYRVKKSKSTGRLYASLLVATGDEDKPYRYERAVGALRLIRPEHRMSADEIKAFGRVSGQCMDCCRTLTKPESIAAGIGPICAKKF